MPSHRVPCHMPEPIRTALCGVLLAILAGCTGMDPDPDIATRREEATMRTLVHREDSFESIYKVLTARGYGCSDQKTTNGKGRGLVCSKDFGWKQGCPYLVLVQRDKTEELDNFSIWSGPACH